MELDSDGQAVIYRVEHDGPVRGFHSPHAGPFTGPGNQYTYEQYKHWFNRMPTPWQDDIHMDSDALICAFPSWEKLRYWMRYNRVPGALQRHGYVVRVFVTAPRHVQVGKSGHQCVFKREHATIVATMKPKEALS